MDENIMGVNVNPNELSRYARAATAREDEESGTILVNDLKKVLLGRQGENDTQTVVIDASAWLTELPSCQLTVAALRPGEREVYLPSVTVSNGVITWPILLQDTALAGTGKAEVRAIKNGKVKKSVVFWTRIEPSLEGDGTPNPPTPPDWAVEILDAVEEAEEAAASAAASAEATAEAAVNSIRYDAAQSLTDAQKATARGNVGAASAAELAGKVSITQGAVNTGKALVVGNDGNVTLGEAGIPEAVKTALLNIFRKVAYVDESGQTLYDALEEALGGTSLLYQLSQPTRFTNQSSYIDTEVTPNVGGIYTILIEYASDLVGDTGMCIFGSVADSAHFSISRIEKHWSTHNPIVYGFGQSDPQDRGIQNSARGAIARHAIVFDLTGEQNPTRSLVTHEYRNLSKGWSETYNNVQSTTLEYVENYDSFKVGGSTHESYTVFRGLISDFRIYSKALSSNEIEDFLTAVPAHSFGSDVIYEMPEITTFDGTNYIDTQVSLAENSVRTVLIEYEPSAFDTASGTDLVHFVLSSTQPGLGGGAIQVQHQSNAGKDVTWGFGLAWQDTQSNAGVNNVMRDILVFDTRTGAASSGKYLVKRYYLNQTLNISSSTTTESAISANTYLNKFWIGGRGDAGSSGNGRYFKGRVVSCRIINREPTQDERERFLNYGR